MLRYALVSVTVWLATFVVLAPPTTAQEVPRTPWGTPDLVGIWDFRTVTPLERPKELAGQEFLTDEEAAEFEESSIDRLYAGARSAGATLAEYELWPDIGTEMAGDNRTSLIVDPPDGRIPPRTATGQRRSETVAARPFKRAADDPEDRTLSERCIM